MEIIRVRGPFAEFAASGMSDDFVLLDIGCSGGIDSVWRILADRLRAFGFDPNVQEVERLRQAEISDKVRYEAAFVGVPSSHPISMRRNGRSPFGRSFWARLACARTLEVMQEEIKAASNERKTVLNAWNTVELAQPAKVFLPDYIETNKISDIDFLKIDIDGDDFDVLCSLENELSSRSVLGICAEVNFFGSESPTEHTFHNTDRFLKAQGFELYALTTRGYAMGALPERYCFSVPAQSVSGRVFQGDAIYMRDLCAPDYKTLAESYGGVKLLKLAFVFSLAGLPDCAAEVLVTFRPLIEGLIDIDRGLDLLVKESSLGRDNDWTYQELMRQFMQNERSVYSY